MKIDNKDTKMFFVRVSDPWNAHVNGSPGLVIFGLKIMREKSDADRCVKSVSVRLRADQDIFSGRLIKFPRLMDENGKFALMFTFGEKIVRLLGWRNFSYLYNADGIAADESGYSGVFVLNARRKKVCLATDLIFDVNWSCGRVDSFDLPIPKSVVDDYKNIEAVYDQVG